MAFRKVFLAVPLKPHLTRKYSHLAVLPTSNPEVTILSLQRKPVNSMNCELLDEMDNAMSSLETNGKTRGVIITSGLPGVFSAGLDITEMSQPERLGEFWKRVQQMWLRVYPSPLATIAAINVILLILYFPFILSFSNRMAFRKVFLAVPLKPHLTRKYSHLAVLPTSNPEVTILSLQRKPVNSMNCELLDEMDNAMSSLETNGKTRGVIITSGLPGVFSAGLDITEMSQPERLGEFWKRVQQMWLRVYPSPLATIAAINGNSPAGGCFLSLMCDYRIMAEGPYKIGMNETQLGLTPPFWIQKTMQYAIGRRESEKALSLGSLYSTEEALRVHVVDKLVPQEQLMDAAQLEIQRWLSIDDTARNVMKQQYRAELVRELRTKREEDIAHFCEYTSRESTQAIIHGYLAALSNKSNKTRKD